MAKKKPTLKTTSDKAWHKVKQPLPWKGEKFDELIGKYTVSIKKQGRFGDYYQHCILSEDGAYFVTGIIADGLFAHVPPGEIVKLRCLGEKKQVDSYMKLYELFTARPISMKLDGEIAEEPVEQVPPQAMIDEALPPPY